MPLFPDDPAAYDFILRIGAALLCGTLVGVHRPDRGRRAGLRTNALVSIRPPFFTDLSTTASAPPGPSRVAAQVVEGIGYPGAGAVPRPEGIVQRLATAGALQAAAVTRTPAGAGLVGTAVLASLAFLLVRKPSRSLGRRIDLTASRDEEKQRSDLTGRAGAGPSVAEGADALPPSSRGRAELPRMIHAVTPRAPRRSTEPRHESGAPELRRASRVAPMPVRPSRAEWRAHARRTNRAADLAPASKGETLRITCLRGPCRLVAALPPLLSILAARPATAARPMITDDARTVDAKTCQVEAWARGSRSSTEYWVLPACAFIDALELTVGGARTRGAGGSTTTDVVVQGKTVFKPLETNGWGIGLAVGMDRHSQAGSSTPDWYAYVPVTFSLRDDAFALHANLGWLREGHTGHDRLTWGLGTEARLTERTGLVAEIFGDDRGVPHHQLGLRHWLAPGRLQIDATCGGRTGGGSRERWFSLGLRLLSARLLP